MWFPALCASARIVWLRTKERQAKIDELTGTVAQKEKVWVVHIFFFHSTHFGEKKGGRTTGLCKKTNLCAIFAVLVLGADLFFFFGGIESL